MQQELKGSGSASTSKTQRKHHGPPTRPWRPALKKSSCLNTVGNLILDLIVLVSQIVTCLLLIVDPQMALS